MVDRVKLAISRKISTVPMMNWGLLKKKFFGASGVTKIEKACRHFVARLHELASMKTQPEVHDAKLVHRKSVSRSIGSRSVDYLWSGGPRWLVN